MPVSRSILGIDVENEDAKNHKSYVQKLQKRLQYSDKVAAGEC